MQCPKVRIFVAIFAYGGNGGVASLVPDLAIWLVKAVLQLKADPRVLDIQWEVFSDTPVTLTRNKAVRTATERGCDMLLMLDNDNSPDAYLGRDPEAKAFLDSAFPFAYDRLKRGLPTVIAAPYCGPPPNPCPPPGVTDNGEVPYLFQWSNTESNSPDCKFKIEMLSRREAAQLRGIYPMAALPTGVCLFTLNAFEGMKVPHFYYEFNEDHSEKRSTEDVTCTRDISLFWQMTQGIDVIFAACDSWALHHKPKRVGKPNIVTLEEIGSSMREAILENVSKADTIQYVDFTKGLPEGVTPEQIKMLPARGEAAPLHNFPYVTARTDNQDNGVKFSIKPNPVEEPVELHAPPVQQLKRRWEHLGPEDDFIYVSDDEWKTLEASAQWEKDEEARRAPVDQAAVLAAVDQAFTEDEESTDVEDASDLDDYSPVVDEEPKKTNGQPLRHKMVGSRKVAILKYEVSDKSVENLQALTSWFIEKREQTPVDVAVVHPGTGQSAAAVLQLLPENSRLYALDHTMVYGFSGDYAQHFRESFAKELENGTVKAEIDARKFPETKGWEVDMVLIERFVKREKLEQWLRHIVPGGLLAGLGYEDPETRQLVDEFKTEHKLQLQAAGDVWAIPVK